MATIRGLLFGLGLGVGLATTAMAQDALPCNSLCRFWLGRSSPDAAEDAAAEAPPAPVPVFRSREPHTEPRRIDRSSTARQHTQPRRMKVSFGRRQQRAGPVAVIQPVSAPLTSALTRPQTPAVAPLLTPATAPPPTSAGAFPPTPAVPAAPAAMKAPASDVSPALLD